MPACYLHAPPRLQPGYFAKFQQDTLFYIFYSMPGDEAQLLAADELSARQWWFHKACSCLLLLFCDPAAVAARLLLVHLCLHVDVVKRPGAQCATCACTRDGAARLLLTSHGILKSGIACFGALQDFKLWLTRIPNTEPIMKTERFERGSYLVFDTATWDAVRKDNFVVRPYLRLLPSTGDAADGLHTNFPLSCRL